MDNLYTLIISSPDGKMFEDKVSFLSLRGINGDLAILKNHIPFSTTIVPSTCKIICEDESTKYADIKSGILTVSKDKTIILSSDFSWK